MKNTSKGFAWVLTLVILALVGAAGVGAWVALKKPSTNPDLNTSGDINSNDGVNDYTGAQTTTSPSSTNLTNNTVTSSDTEARIEFPWSKYDATLNIRAASTSTKLIGGTVNVGGYGKATTVIGKTVNLGGAAKITNVYVFDKLLFAANGRIEKLYVESGTSLQIGTGATVGQKIVLSHNDLVRQAEAAADATTLAPVSSSSGSSTSTSTSTSSSTTVSATDAAALLAKFNGEWNGTFSSSSSLAGTPCQSSGPVSLSIDSSGDVTGYATVSGIKAPGTGKVDSTGKLTGSWNYTGTNLTYTGKINSTTNTGSGSYQNSLGCFGTFSVSK